MKTFFGMAISLSVLALSAQAQTPTFTAASVVNSASMTAGPIAPGMVVAIMGSNLGDARFPGNCMNVTPLPATCTAVTVLINGAPAPKIYDSASEVTFQAPFSLTGNSATLQVTSTLSGASLASATVTVPVAPVNPGLFSAGGTGSGLGYYFDATQSGLSPQYSRGVYPGDTVLLFATGFGVTNPAVATGALAPSGGAGAVASVTLSINNQSVPVTYGGLEPGNQSSTVVGYDEVVFTVPAGLTQGSYPMVVSVGGTASNSVNLTVAAAPVTITSVSPSPVPLSANPQTVTFNGTGFEQNLTLKLQSPSLQQTTVSGASINFISATQFTAQITVGTTAGSWGALVINPDNTQSSVFSFTASGNAPTGATITSIVTTSSNATQLAQNSWIEVHGANLANTTTTWSNADFSKGLPTTLANVSATVNGKPVAIYYVSPTQVNLLTPLDAATGSVSVQLTTPNGTTAPTPVTEVQAAPALLVIDVAGHVAAEHVPSLSLLGPPSLNAPGYTFTPATRGESITLYATGFGQTSPALANQLSNQGPYPSNLATLPSVTIGNLPATVSFAGAVGPGLYQINLTVPNSAPSGDLAIIATYNGASTQGTAVITVQ